MFKRILISAALVSAVSLASHGHVNAEGLSPKSSGFSDYENRKLRRRLVQDYLNNGLRHSSTPSFIRLGSNSVDVNSSSSSGSSYKPVYRPSEIFGPLNSVSHIKHISEDMVELADSRAEWRAANGIPEQTKSIIVIAGASPEGERVSAPTFMPDTYSQSVDDESEILFFND